MRLNYMYHIKFKRFFIVLSAMVLGCSIVHAQTFDQVSSLMDKLASVKYGGQKDRSNPDLISYKLLEKRNRATAKDEPLAIEGAKKMKEILNNTSDFAASFISFSNDINKQEKDILASAKENMGYPKLKSRSISDYIFGTPKNPAQNLQLGIISMDKNLNNIISLLENNTKQLTIANDWSINNALVVDALYRMFKKVLVALAEEMLVEKNITYKPFLENMSKKIGNITDLLEPISGLPR